MPRILIVDDEPGVTLLCKRILTRAGHEVTATTEPREALEQLRSHPFDLIVVDIRMPEVDGFDVIAHARQQQPEIAVLIMTGFGTLETAIRALRQGVDGLLLKPFENSNELIQAVAQALADNQEKRDAGRMQALRPLFDVTETLLTETRTERLLDLIVNAVCGYLRCSSAAYYRYLPDDGRLHLLAGKGITFSDQLASAESGLIGYAHALGAPLWVNAHGPGQPQIQTWLADYRLSSVLCVPFARQNASSILYAGRSSDEPPFRDVDLEMLMLFTRQAAIALENAGLYEELRAYVRRVEESQQALLQAEKMAAAGRLTASIAHEINNPLQAVQNCLHLAGRKDLSAKKRSEYFALAQQELERLMSTVQRMLDFYRPGTISPEMLDVGELLLSVIDLMTPQLEKSGIIINLEVAADLPRIRAVGSQLKQVFINLILNAFDAMPQGGRLDITARRVRGGVEIFVQDTGPGIPAELIPNIFEPFVSTKSGGTGLGLTVSYNIVTAHGGTLELLPEIGPGACFRVFLPLGGRR